MSESLARAVAAAQAWLSSTGQPEAAIAAHESGAADSDEYARRWVDRLLDQQEPSGSWGGDVIATAEALLAVQELRAAAGLLERRPEINRALDWLRARQGVAGAWTDGCSPDRHQRGLCHHFMGGFFSPGPPEVPQPEAWLRNGLHLRGDAEVRFAASAVALRCVLRWGSGGADARLHLEGLRRVLSLWAEGPPAGLSTASLLAAAHALIFSSDRADQEAAERGLRLIAGKQRGDGSWVEADAFQALEVFGAAADAGLDLDRTRRALWHGARLLIASQQSDGSWGREHGARRTLIAWRTFRRLEPPEG